MSAACPICPHCNRSIDNHAVERHVAACPWNPPIRQALAVNLRDPEYPAHLRRRHDYDELGAKPLSSTLIKMLGSWEAAGEFVGLLPPRHANANERQHERRMAATATELRRLAAELHGGLFGPSRREYELNMRRGDGLSDVPVLAEALRRRFGAWENVLAHFGMLPPDEEEDGEPDGRRRDYPDPVGGRAYWFDWRTDNDGYVTVMRCWLPGPGMLPE